MTEDIHNPCSQEIVPEPGSIGPFRKMMHRGTKPKDKRLHTDFASDPGDYGCGQYWTNDQNFAREYGQVKANEIVLEHVYHIPSDELKSVIDEYRTCKLEDGHGERLRNAKRLTRMFLEKGYEAVLTFGYESFDIYGLCILSRD